MPAFLAEAHADAEAQAQVQEPQEQVGEVQVGNVNSANSPVVVSQLVKQLTNIIIISSKEKKADEQMTSVGQFVLYGKNHEWELLLLSSDEATNMGQHTNVVAPGQAEAAGVPSSIDCSDGKHKALGYLIKTIKKATNTPGKTYLYCTRVEPGFLLIHTETSMPTQNW